MSDPNLDELAAELADFAEPEKNGGRPPREERIIAGFEEIQRLPKSTDAPRNTGRDATFSSAYMPCALTA